MTTTGRRYSYVGPPESRPTDPKHGSGHAVRSATDLDAWLVERGTAECAEPFTFVITPDALLRLAPRRSEHVVCAGGGEVLAAGEMGFRHASGRWAVEEVTNQSAGYCPDLDSWHPVAAALDRAGIGRPDGFTHEVVFRRCERCRECSVVREGDFVCVFCGSDLPTVWNITS
ncbi:hypothetical protein [Streptomyces sp. YU58]|uniref:hypothetical protein n=1 Tax=Streptomyces sp. SX92 TaxID=3158972 RepID=UPI0027B97D7A|nr:hypothetical protein [Streptomyces coralus]WLW57134.1 hypothetical protein QU709_39770 [Streptomyces coralus]